MMRRKVAWVLFETVLTSALFVVFWLTYKWATLPTGLTADIYEGAAIMLAIFVPFYFAMRFWMQPRSGRASGS